MNEKNNVVVVSEIDQALAKENVTEQVIADLKKNYLGLTIAGKEDTQGYEIVKRARIECRDLRNLAIKIAKKGREHSNAVSKAWIEKEKEVVSQISEVEDYLQEQQDIIDNEEKRILEERYEKRKAQLHAVEYHGDWTDISTISDEMFNLILSQTTKEYDAIILQRAEDERIKEEEEARLAKQKEDQEAEAIRLDGIKKEQEEKDRLQREEQDRIDKEKKKLEDEKIAEELRKKHEKELEDEKEKARLKGIEDEKKRLEDEKIAEEQRLRALPDLEKMSNYAQQLKAIPVPVVETAEGRDVLIEATRYLSLAIHVLESK